MTGHKKSSRKCSLYDTLQPEAAAVETETSESESEEELVENFGGDKSDTEFLENIDLSGASDQDWSSDAESIEVTTVVVGEDNEVEHVF